MRLAVFDFDGTIADTMDAYIEISNDVLVELGYPRMTKTQIETLRNMNPVAALKITGFPKRKIPHMVKRSRELLRSHYPNIDTFSGMHEELQKIREQGIAMGILTSNSRENIEPFLARHHFHQHFDFIHTKSAYFGKAKHLKKIAKQRKAPKKHIVFIGDEVRDVEAARRAGVYSIAVTWGAHTQQVLSESQPTAIVSQVNNLAREISNQLS